MKERDEAREEDRDEDKVLRTATKGSKVVACLCELVEQGNTV